MAKANHDQLMRFLEKVKSSEQQGKKTKSDIKKLAQKFLNDSPFDEYEEFEKDGEKYDIHDYLAAFIYDNI